MRIPVPSRIGILSDTHGTLNPLIFEEFGDVDLVIHAGDVGSPGLLLELEALAPLLAVRGNTDRGAWAHVLPDLDIAYVGDKLVAVVHDVSDAALPAGIDVVVSGHTHRPSIAAKAGVLHLNPGSPSEPRGSDARSTVMLLDVRPKRLLPHIVHL